MQLSALEEEGRELPGAGPPPETQAARQEMKALLQTALQELPLEYREVYELRDLRNVRGAEVAKKLGISLAAMKSRLHRGRALMRARLDAALAPAGSRK